MSNDEQYEERAFISYIDERNIKREGWFTLIHLDSSFVKFKTRHGVRIIIPTIRILKIKYEESDLND